jgi:hypothetical protein
MRGLMFLSVIGLVLPVLGQVVANPAKEGAGLQVKASGRGCPAVQQIELSGDDLLVVTFSAPLRVTSGAKPFAREFCQLSLTPVSGTKARHYELLGLHLTGENHLQGTSQAKVDLLTYKQGEREQWQKTLSFKAPKSSAPKDSNWQIQESWPEPLVIPCQAKRATQLKVGLFQRSTPSAKAADSSFQVHSKWQFKLRHRPCQASSP